MEKTKFAGDDEPVWHHQKLSAHDNALELLDHFALRISYSAGQKIYQEETSVEYWYRVVSGAARRYSINAEGKRQIVDLLFPKDCFGFGMQGRHRFAAEAVLDGTIIAWYPRARLELLAESDPRMGRALRDVAHQAMSRLHSLILNLGRTRAEEKVGLFLLRLADRLSAGSADRVVLPVSREDIADYLALSVETVSRSLTQLKSRGMIRLTGTREIIILDRQALASGDEDQLAIADHASGGREPLTRLARYG
jgi:CRP/FNR family nitrogen fixation transcriptional regulator